MSSSISPIPSGVSNLIPYLTCADAPAAIEFYQRAFGAVELMRIAAADGKIMHASLQIGDSMMMLSEEVPEWGSMGPNALGGSPVGIHVYVEDVEVAWEQAVEAGCEVVMPLEDAFWGERFGALRDPFGHKWSLSMRIRDMTAEEIQAAAAELQPGCGD